MKKELNINAYKVSKSSTLPLVNKKTKRTALFFLEIFMLFSCLVMSLPLMFALLNSFKTPAEASLLNFKLPTYWKFDNYLIVIKEGRLINGFLNSCFVTIFSVLLILACACFASFVLGRRQTKFMNKMYAFFVLGLIPPPFAIPTVKFLQMMGLNSKYLGLILFYCAIYMPFSIFFITGFIKTVPRELDESAIIEGCNPLRMFVSIILPLLKPVIVTTTIFCFMFIWNDFTWPLYLLNDSSKWTIPLTVFSFKSKYGTMWELVFADLIIAALPVCILYFVAQDSIVEGMTAGAVKG